ncbi:MAG: acyltransferase [Actinobacteria bacterium]|nr:acyltransferase [Actinomycetota bacterium]
MVSTVASSTVASSVDADAAAPQRDGPRLPYLPGVDGLRAVAVGSVLLYHAEFAWMVGGYLGVEVFFVISGYLITSLLLAENARTGTIGLKEFYLRRARRLLPALFLTLIGVLVLAELFARDQVASLRGDVIAAFGYVTNWYFIFAEKSYFESGSPSFVKHLWSLAIEEQFYVIWPLLFTGLLAIFGRRRVLFVVLAMAAASAIWMAYLFANIDLAETNALNRVYMGTDTRAAGLLIGASLAILWSPWRLKADVGKWAPWLLDAIGAIALALIGWALYGLPDSAPQLYQFGFAKISILTAIVIAVAAHPAAHFGKVLGCEPMRWIGLRSYGIYLYHFPIFLLIKPDPVTDPQPNLYSYFIVRLAVTLIVTEVSFRFVEMPVRKGALGRLRTSFRSASGPRKQQLRLRWFTGAIASVLALGMLALVVGRAQPASEPDYIAIGTGGQSIEDLSMSEVGIGPDGATASGEVASVDPSTILGDPNAPAATLAGIPNPARETDPGAPETVIPVPELPPAPPTTLAPPVTTPHGPVRAIGDSVMLGARPTLLNALGANSAVDAAVSRQVAYAIQKMQQWNELGQIPDVLIIHLGTNGTFNAQEFDALMEAAKNVRKVLFVTNKVPRRWQDTNNAAIGEGTRRYPDQAVLVDWYSASIDRPEYFAPDGYHLKPEGAQAYANLILSKMG